MRRTLLIGAVTPIVASGNPRLHTNGFARSVAETYRRLQRARKASGFWLESAAIGDRRTVPAVATFGRTCRMALPIDGHRPPIDPNPVRQRFIELSKKKAYALTEEQLKHEVESMEAEVRELEAWAKAQEAMRLLHEVIEKHPNTKAAETANAAIQLIEQGRNTPYAANAGPVVSFAEAISAQSEPTFPESCAHRTSRPDLNEALSRTADLKRPARPPACDRRSLAGRPCGLRPACERCRRSRPVRRRRQPGRDPAAPCQTSHRRDWRLP